MRAWTEQEADGHPFRRMLKNAIHMMRAAAQQWNSDKASQLAAALSYYTIFSAAPLLVMIVAIAGVIIGQQTVLDNLMVHLSHLVGPDGAAMVQSIIQNISKPAAGIPATILSAIALIGGALGVFAQLKGAMNQIWKVTPLPSQGIIKDIIRLVQQQFVAFALIVGIGILVILSLIVSAVLAALTNFVDNQIGQAGAMASLWSLVNFCLTLGIFTALFAAIYKFLPDRYIAWKDVWIGATITALLFSVGKFLIGLYLGRSVVSSVYGAAGSLVILLLWVNYSAQIFFFGAELTQVYATRYGSLLEQTPKPDPREATRPRRPSRALQAPEC